MRNNDNTENLKEIYSEKLYERKGVVIDFRIDRVTLPNGEKVEREYIKHKGAVAVIPVDGEGNVYLVKQFRYAADRVTLEIPAGKLDSEEEEHVAAALRELREETGLAAKELVPVTEYLGSPAINNEIIWIYFASEFVRTEQELDEDEFLNVVKMPLSELVGMTMRGEIRDGKTALAALWAEKYLADKGIIK